LSLSQVDKLLRLAMSHVTRRSRSGFALVSQEEKKGRGRARVCAALASPTSVAPDLSIGMDIDGWKPTSSGPDRGIVTFLPLSVPYLRFRHGRISVCVWCMGAHMAVRTFLVFGFISAVSITFIFSDLGPCPPPLVGCAKPAFVFCWGQFRFQSVSHSSNMRRFVFQSLLAQVSQVSICPGSPSPVLTRMRHYFQRPAARQFSSLRPVWF